MVCKSIKFLANAKHFGLWCLFDVWFIIDGIILWLFHFVLKRYYMWGFKTWIKDGWILNVL